MQEIIKAFLLKWVRAGQSRELTLTALGMLIILFGEEAGIAAVATPLAKLAVGLVTMAGVGGLVAMKYIDAIKPVEKPLQISLRSVSEGVTIAQPDTIHGGTETISVSGNS